MPACPTSRLQPREPHRGTGRRWAGAAARWAVLLASLLLAEASVAAEVVSVPFPVGIIGTIGQNTGKVTNISNFASLDIMAGHFRQVSENGQFGGTQGNDLSGTLRLVLSGGSTIDIVGAINWRITTNGKVDYFGFIPEPGHSTTLPAGLVLDDASNYAVGKLSTTLSFSDGDDVSGNAALSGLVDELNLYLAEVSAGAPLISGPEGAAGAGSASITLPEGTLPVWDYSGDTAVSWRTAGGADEAQFSIDAVTGQLSFIAPPAYDAPTDSGADNSYEVLIQATDEAGRTSLQSLVVTITRADPLVAVISARKALEAIALPAPDFDCATGPADPSVRFHLPGLCVEYVITVESEANGSDPAQNVTITDSLPDDLIFVALVASSGFDDVHLSGSDVIGTISSLMAGGTAELRFRALLR